MTVGIDKTNVKFQRSVGELSDEFTQAVKQFLETGDFLSFSLSHSQSLESAFSFKVAVLSEQFQKYYLDVNVIATGMITFELEQHSSSMLQAVKNIVLSSGVHGNETAPIELCSELITELLLGNIALKQRVLFIFGNLAAINQGTRFVEKNLNSLFSLDDAELEACPEYIRAKQLEKELCQFFENSDANSCYHLDLHTAIRDSVYEKFAISPYLHGKAYSGELLTWLENFAVTTLLLASSPTHALSYFSSKSCGAHALTIELGKARPFGCNAYLDLAEIRAGLINLLSANPLAIKGVNLKQFKVFKTKQIINKEFNDFHFAFADDVPNFTEFKYDQLLASQGQIEHRVSEDHEAIVFPNANVAIGQRALLTVVQCNNINISQ